MKAIIVIFIIYTIYAISCDDAKKYIYKSYPKKMTLNKNVNRIFIRPGYVHSKSPRIMRPGLGSFRNYTVFESFNPSMDDRRISIPGSPYFPDDIPYGVNSEYKNSNYEWTIKLRRYKRSADEKKMESTVEVTTDKTTTSIDAKKDEESSTQSTSKKSEDTETKTTKVNQPAPQDTTAVESTKTTTKAPTEIVNSTPVATEHSTSDISKTSTASSNTAMSTNQDGRRLIAAREAEIEEYPYVVSIQKNYQHWCSGAILNPTLVITTANCMWKSISISRMTVRAGTSRANSGGQQARIKEVIKHPGWNIRKAPDCDLALVLLDRKLKFSNKIHSVDLPNRMMLPAFDDMWVTSWGAESRDGVYKSSNADMLQVYHARLMKHAKCNNITKRFLVTVTKNFLCLAQTGRVSPCTRDTGAPAVSDGILWGLASWGLRKLCGTERYPAMFSYLASKQNIDFIANATHVLMADKRFYPFPDRQGVRPAPPVMLVEQPH